MLIIADDIDIKLNIIFFIIDPDINPTKLSISHNDAIIRSCISV